MSEITLPPVARKVDAALAEIDAKIDWLYYLSPLGNDQMWQEFKDSHFTQTPKLSYPAIPSDYASLMQKLRDLPIDDIEDDALHVLFFEKQMELELQVELVQMRNTPGFKPISVELFGEAEPSLLRLARNILRTVPRVSGPADDADCEQVVKASEQELAAYRKQVPDLYSQVDVLDDLNSMMMVHHGHLKIAKSVKLPNERIYPLVAHEVGTHIVTRYNGYCQPIKLLEFGLAHYDPLQEGLGTLSEYLAGYLPPRRLRIIAARVVATDLALQGKDITQIFSQLHEEYGLQPVDAFDIAVRACRGGGLTKDSVYLRGLRELMAYLADDGDFEFLFLGKFAMGQRTTIQSLLDRNWLVRPRLLPRHLTDEGAIKRLKRVRNLNLEQLFQEEPE
ncbi:tyrosine/phenylalanine carboxypeptidase domain-containing protein [Alteromonas sp. ASW11-130]|uniref:tyrosine/phenylalanine carboxypeptidase domain-containing protein n=1 Tax=Alteromonas sp. ASW11-130 TaxID=3015775 RepID=UPI002242BE65|nr:tyrosine/phenylalanine carboxypeptidase domain-containing protein [Alteromonas sp. ASW11-130]MCW8090832.1 flavohemoglobin expression-modulating QEGLA motif protein [Alteromonas sp. ASW11-130]